jgi:hypothetical protein
MGNVLTNRETVELLMDPVPKEFDSGCKIIPLSKWSSELNNPFNYTRCHAISISYSQSSSHEV